MQALEQLVLAHVFREEELDLEALQLAVGTWPLTSKRDFLRSMKPQCPGLHVDQREVLAPAKGVAGRDRSWERATERALQARGLALPFGEAGDLLRAMEVIKEWGDGDGRTDLQDSDPDHLLIWLFGFKSHQAGMRRACAIVLRAMRDTGLCDLVGGRAGVSGDKVQEEEPPAKRSCHHGEE